MAVKAKEQVTVSWIIDIASTTKYYLLQSSTAAPPSKPTANPPGGNWKTTEPAYTSGSTNTLYTVEQTLWTNGKVTYSAVCKSSAYEAAKEAWNKAQNAQNTANSANSKIDGLEIGGRNLALQTKDFKTGSEFWSIGSSFTKSVDEEGFTVLSSIRKGATGATWDRAIPHRYIPVAEMYRGVTVSFDFMCDTVSELDPGVIIALQIYNKSGNRIGWYESANIKTGTGLKLSAPLEDGKWIRVSAYFSEDVLKTTSSGTQISKADVSYTSVSLQLVKNGSIHYRRFKMEYGNKATDWTPAPEDTDIKIESYVESEIKKEEDSIKLWAGQTYTTKTDFNSLAGRTGALETWKTEASQKITKDGIIATVGSYYTKDADFQSATNRITNAESRITQLNDSIELKVEKDGIISAINQTSESVTISASKINLSGYVSVSDIKTAGKTTINGSNVTTGMISADRIDAKSLFAKQLDATNLHVTGQSSIDGGLVASGINANNITVGTLSADRIDAKSLFAKQLDATNLHVTGKSSIDGGLVTSGINANNITVGTLSADRIDAKSLFAKTLDATNLHITGNSTFDGTLKGAGGTFSGTLSVTRTFSTGDASVVIGAEDTARAITIKPIGLKDEYYINYDGTAHFHSVNAGLFDGDATAALAIKAGGTTTGSTMKFNWSGKTGQPTWLWGGNDVSNMYVYNPSNFSVASAAVATHVSIPRVDTDVNANGRPALNRAFWREYNSGCSYLPSAHWYHIFTAQGADDNFTTQLALGMTTQKVAYRLRSNGTWGDWREIPLLSKIGDLTVPAGLYPTTGIYDKHGYSNTTTNLNYACYVSSNYRIARYASSSRRYKHDITEIFDATCRPEALYDLPVVTYRYNDGYCPDEPHGEKLHIGFIAEDVDRLYPAGCGYRDGVPENWNIMEVVPGMLKLIQDQHRDIIRQSTRQDAIETRIESLQYQLQQAFVKIEELKKRLKAAQA